MRTGRLQANSAVKKGIYSVVSKSLPNMGKKDDKKLQRRDSKTSKKSRKKKKKKKEQVRWQRGDAFRTGSPPLGRRQNS